MRFKNQRVFLTGAAICLLFAGLIYYYNNYKIPYASKKTEIQVRKEIDDNSLPKIKVAVVASIEGINKYTEITNKIINERIKLVDVPEKYVVKGAATQLLNIKGKIAKEDLRFGEQIILDSLSAEKKWYGEFQRLKEYEVSSIVADEVKTGNIVDIMVSYGNGDYDVVLPKVKVMRLISSKKPVDSKSSKVEEPEDTGDMQYRGQHLSYTIVIAVDEEQYRDLELAKQMGKFETRLYIDENQTSSKKTFYYKTAIDKRNFSEIKSKTGVTSAR
ncbi:MAG: hypothetical protein N3I35_11570 [Clostridia bacterium]|nr:hypothetical protein [Clostridia bacterium]